MPFQDPLRELAGICAKLEIQQESHEDIRTKVSDFKKKCIKLLGQPKEHAKITLRELINSLNTIFQNEIIQNETPFLIYLNKEKTDPKNLENICEKILSMDDYGLEGNEDEDLKKDARISAFHSAVDDIRSDMQTGLKKVIKKPLSLKTGYHISEIKSTQAETPSEINTKSLEGKSVESVDPKEQKQIEQYQIIYEALYKRHQRPENLTIPDLYNATMQNFSLPDEFKTTVIISGKIKSVLEHEYLIKSIITLQSKQIITPYESHEVIETFKRENAHFQSDDDKLFGDNLFSEKDRLLEQTADEALDLAQKNQNIYKNVCVNNQRPANLIISDLYEAIIYQFNLLKFIYHNKDSIDTTQDQQVQKNYFESEINKLLGKNIINPEEKLELETLFNQANNIQVVKISYRP